MTNSIKETLLNNQKLSRELNLQNLPQFVNAKNTGFDNKNASDFIPLIKTAVEFLKAPQFKTLSLREKEQFLLSRGLNWTQIELAFKLASNNKLSSSKRFSIDDFLKAELTQLPKLPPRIEYNSAELTQNTLKLNPKLSIWQLAVKSYRLVKPFAIGSIIIYLLITYTILPLLKHYSIRRKRLTDREERYKKLYNLCQSQANSISNSETTQEELKANEKVKDKERDLQDLVLLREEGVPKLMRQIKDYKNYLELEKGKYSSDYYSKDYWSYSKVPGANVKSELRSFKGFILNSKNFQ